MCDHATNLCLIDQDSSDQTFYLTIMWDKVTSSVADLDPNPEDPYIFEPLGSGSISQRYGSGSFYH